MTCYNSRGRQSLLRFRPSRSLSPNQRWKQSTHYWTQNLCLENQRFQLRHLTAYTLVLDSAHQPSRDPYQRFNPHPGFRNQRLESVRARRAAVDFPLRIRRL